jgi:hypothetical protein
LIEEREFVTYRGDRIPHPKEQRRYSEELTKDVPDDAGPDDVPPEIEAASEEYYGRIHAAIDARVAADMMRDPDPAWHREGLMAACRLEDTGLAMALLDDAHGGVRGTAVLTVWHLEAAEAAPTLVRLLAEDPDEHVRMFSAVVLGHLSTDGAVEALIDALNDEWDKVVSSACIALSKYHDVRAIDALFRVLKTHASWDLRYHALRTLDDLGCRDRAMLPWVDWLTSDAEEMDNLRDIEQSIEESDEEIKKQSGPDAAGTEAEAEGEAKERYEPFDDVVARLRIEIPTGA